MKHIIKLIGVFTILLMSTSIQSQTECGDGGLLTGGPFFFIAGDGIADNIPEGAITLSDNEGTNSQWVVTDVNGIILGLPPMPSVVDFDGAGAGNCLVWHLSFEGELIGAAPGLNANDIQGCYSLSNPIDVVRTVSGDCQANGGILFGGPFEFTAGDGEGDFIPEGAITVANSQGSNSQWVVTDVNGIILGLPPMPSVVDFDGAGAGNCLVWHLSFEGELIGAAPGLNANDIQGCYSLSNPVDVVRTVPGDCQANGGILFGGPFEFTAGDGEGDFIPEGAITVANSQGTNSQWVVTDIDGNILGLPPTYSVVDFDGAGAGTCLVWYLTYEGEIIGAEMGANASDIQGCYSLSNPVEVERTEFIEDCSAFYSAPTDLDATMNPVPFPNGVMDRIQLKFFKENGRVKYSSADNAACDIEYWAYQLIENGEVLDIDPADTDTTLISFTRVRKTNGNPLFKWPVFFTDKSGGNTVAPNTVYKWRTRCYCDQGNTTDANGDMIITPWSEVSSFETPDFDLFTGIYSPSGNANSTANSKSRNINERTASLEFNVYPNPSFGNMQLNLEGISAEGIEYLIIDPLGKMVDSGNLSLDRQSVVELDLTGIQPGPYLLYLNSQEASGVKRIFKK